VTEPNRLRQAAVPNVVSTPGGAADRAAPVPTDPAASDDTLDHGELEELDDLDDPHDLGAEVDHPRAAAIAQADLDRRVREAVDTALADQTAAVAAARRRGRIGFVAGLLVAAAGVPLFFGASLASELAGIALICLGVGAALLSILIAAARADIGASRRSTAAAVTNTLLLPHTAIVWVAAIGLVAFGFLALIAAAQTR
jgi:hypothetical protein